MITIQEILNQAVEREASDIFLIAGHPYAFKINGVIATIGQDKLKPEDTRALIQAIYSYVSQNSYEDFLVKKDDDFSFSIPSTGRFRVNVYLQRNSQAAVIRVVRFELPDTLVLGIPETVINLAKTSKGLILISGSAGCGKSTTLACIIDAINKTRNAHIITIEDPIEYLHNHSKSIVSQREVYHDTHDYLSALKSALREAPEVIQVGELRDLETIEVAVTAAETGHLILSTVHTIGAANTVDRLIDVFPPSQQQQIRFQLSMTLQAVVSEKLLPNKAGKIIPAFEIMLVNNAIRSQIREGKTHQLENSILSGRDQGMITMDDSLWNLYKDYQIDEETLLLNCVHADRMKKRILEG